MTHEHLIERVNETYRQIALVDRPEIWIHLRPRDEVLKDAYALAERETAGEFLPLAGFTVAVKDNIDVAGIATTAGTPDALHVPDCDATVVALLRRAGALIIGKTNMDQFATGLVGTRSPYGAVRCARQPELVSGGSSSGSAVAVALGLVDLALGTDTAGSGRIPAAFNNIIGVKPTLGLLSNTGVFPASPSYDTVTVFSRTLAEAEAALSVLAQTDAADPGSRAWPADVPLDAPGTIRVGIPAPDNLRVMTPRWRTAFESAAAELPRDRWTPVEVDISFLLDAAKLLYDGALVAERTSAFGDRLAALGDRADPSVRTVVNRGYEKPAVDLVADQQALLRYRRDAERLWRTVNMLLLPTAPGQPTLAEVAAAPLAVNAWLGTYPNFVNLLDCAAVAGPRPPPDAGDSSDGDVGAGQTASYGATLVGPAFSDIRLHQAARRFTGQTVPASGTRWLPPHYLLAVFGAHLTGQPLNNQLTEGGATLIGFINTAPEYSLHALPVEPPKPGLVRVGQQGYSVPGELWALPASTFAFITARTPSPLTIGKVLLSNGSEVSGFLCEPHAAATAPDISEYGSWRAYVENASGSPVPLVAAGPAR